MFKTSLLPNCKSQGPEILKNVHQPLWVKCHMSYVIRHVSDEIIIPKLLKQGTWNFETMFITPSPSRVTGQMSCVMCCMSCANVTKKLYIFLFLQQIGGASRWRVCYQRGLPCLVSLESRDLSLVAIDNSRYWPRECEVTVFISLPQVKRFGSCVKTNTWR